MMTKPNRLTNTSFIRLFLLSFFVALCTLVSGCNTILDVVKSDQIETNPNKRTTGAKLDDKTIKTVVKHNVAKAHPDLDRSHVEVWSFNGVVLLSGEVPNEEMRTLATETANNVANVRVVHNELVVRGNSSFISRTNDSYIHKRIKFNLSKEDALDGTDIDVVVQDSVAFLMGLVTQEQGEVAAHATSLTGGVRSVIKVFEYIN